VQYWGKRRGIYSNVMGFLGGVNFAILVARICLHYPQATGAAVVRAFFKVFTHWTWSAQNPVMICGIDVGGAVASSVWDSQLAMLQGREIFPIITPCYPASNSTFNVSVRARRHGCSVVACVPAVHDALVVCCASCVARAPSHLLKKALLLRTRGTACLNMHGTQQHPECGMQDCTRSIMIQEIERGKALCDVATLRSGKFLDYAKLTEPFNFFGPNSYANYLQVRHILLQQRCIGNV
jgi:Poly(A) polymerase central domain